MKSVILLQDLVDVANRFAAMGATLDDLMSVVGRCEGYLTQPDDESYQDVQACVAMHPYLSEQEAAAFIAQVKDSGLSWRMGDVLPIVEEEDGERSIRPYERHRVIVDAFDQWCRTLEARWSADRDWIVIDEDMRFEYRCEDADLLVCVELRDTVLRMDYVRAFERYAAASKVLGLDGKSTFDRWLERAGDVPSDTITKGYGVWRGQYETIDHRFGKSPKWMARKRAERNAIQQRAPHIVSLRHQVQVAQEALEIVTIKEDLTPEEIADRYIQNAKKLGRRDFTATDLI